MYTLTEVLNAEGIRPKVIEDVVVLLDEEVERKKGASGFAIRKAFQVVKKIDGGGLLLKAINKLLDRFVVALEPYYLAYTELDDTNRPSFSEYLVNQDEAVAEALLTVTDDIRNHTDNKVAVKGYDRMRPSALGHVKEAIPGVGRLMQKYAFPEPISSPE